MAKTAINFRLENAATYTVPAGKMAILKATAGTSGSGGVQIHVNGVICAQQPGNTPYGPICLNAGDVLSLNNSNTPSISFGGFLYDA